MPDDAIPAQDPDAGNSAEPADHQPADRADDAPSVDVAPAGDGAAGAAAAPSLLRWFWPFLLVTLVLDLITKAWFFALPADFEGSTELEVLRRLDAIWRDWTMVRPSFNRGVAWSMFHEHPGLVALTTLALIPILALVFWRWFRHSSRLEVLAFGSVLGGALGNGWDRLLALRADSTLVFGVRDFIHCDLNHIGIPYIWPTFNVADMGISVGFVALLLSSLRRRPEEPHRPSAAQRSSD